MHFNSPEFLPSNFYYMIINMLLCVLISHAVIIQISIIKNIN